MLQYRLVESHDTKTVSVWVDGQMFDADSTHPNFNVILAAVRGDDGSLTTTDIVRLFDVAQTVSDRLEQLSVRVTLRGNDIYFDDELNTGPLASLILKFINEGADDYKPLVKFWEKVETNPNQHSRENLFNWLQANNFSVADDGDLIAYKGVSGDEFLSVHSGAAFVNGKKIVGHVPNVPGSVVTMPRSDVQHDPSRGCSTGLHVSDFDYASGYGDRVVMVSVNPRDVVSVPTESNWVKMRVCRYTVLKQVDSRVNDTVITTGKHIKRDSKGRFCK